MKKGILASLVLPLLIGTTVLAAAPKLKVSDNGRFLVKEDGKPFFYLADTAWELFHRLNREEAERYLKNRAEKRFTVIQAVVLAELDGLHDPNAYGNTPLLNNDPTRPNEEYFKHVDFIVNKAEELGLFIGMLPTWGDKVGPKGQWGVGPEIFTPENARVYGEWLGKRYKDKPIIWVLGGDRSADNPRVQEIWTAMAAGIKQGDGGNHLFTFHPPGGGNSSKWFHDSQWLSFNMWQNGHCADVPVWERIGKDYARQPIKPVMDGEPLYEDHPICFKAKEMGTSNAADVRHFLYQDLFAGAHGHTYGNHSIWQMYAPNRKPVNGPLNYWFDALDKPGASQMQYARALLESRPYLTRIPDQSVLALKPSSGANAGLKHIAATRSSDGSYALIYIPASRTFTVDLNKLSGETIKAWWFSPRNGQATEAGSFARKGEKDFTPPDVGENVDWVLVLDDASKGFPAPGAAK